MRTTKKWFLSTLSVALCASVCAAGALLGGVGARSADAASEGSETTQATAIQFDGVSTTGVYSVQHYAGLEGNRWVTDDNAVNVTAGETGKRLGSGSNDNRDLTITVKVNAAKATEAQFRLWAEVYESGSRAASISVNGNYIDASGETVAEATEFDFYQLRQAKGGFVTEMPMALNSGVNTVVIDLVQNYNMWIDGFEFAADGIAAKLAADGENTVFRPQSAVFTNNPTVNDTSWGGAKQESPASASYRLFAEEAGAYKFTLGVEAGNANENNAYIAVNGGEQTTIKFDTSKGWGKVADNEVILTLNQGINTVTIGQVIPDGGWVNWWLKDLRAAYVMTRSLTIDAASAKTQYNAYEKVDLTGIVVSYVDSENEANNKQLSLNDVTMTKPLLTEKEKDYQVTAQYTDADGVVCRGAYTVSTVSEVMEYTGDTFAYEGERTDRYTFIGEKGVVGFVKSADANIAWTMNSLTQPNGYSIGSGGGRDGRQLTMHININSTVSQDVYFTIYGQVDNVGNNPDNTTNVVVGGGTPISVDWDTMYDTAARKLVIPLSLVQGENVITFATAKGYNMWLEGFDLAPVPEKVLTLNKTDVKTTYLPYETLDLSGLTAIYQCGDEEPVELEYSDLAVDSSAYNAEVLGIYTLTVSYTPSGEEEPVTEELAVKVGYNETQGGEGTEREGKTISYNGTALAPAPLWAKDGTVGIEGSGQLYWLTGKVNVQLYGDGYELGSGPDDARKMTLVWKINSTVSGKATFTLYGKFYAATTSLKLTVNDFDSSFNPNDRMKGADGQEYIEFEVELREGENEILLALPSGYDAWLRAYAVGTVQVEDSHPNNPDPSIPDGNKPDGSNPDDGSGTDEGKSGCGSSVGVSMLAPLALIAGGACFLVRKKK